MIFEFQPVWVVGPLFCKGDTVCSSSGRLVSQEAARHPPD
jgi:hypothetical protein